MAVLKHHSHGPVVAALPGPVEDRRHVAVHVLRQERDLRRHQNSMDQMKSMDKMPLNPII